MCFCEIVLEGRKLHALDFKVQRLFELQGIDERKLEDKILDTREAQDFLVG